MFLVLHPTKKELLYHGNSESKAKEVYNAHENVVFLLSSTRAEANEVLRAYDMSLPEEAAPTNHKNPIQDFFTEIFGTEEKVEVNTDDIAHYGKVVFEEIAKEVTKATAVYAEPLGNFLIKVGTAIKNKKS